MREVFKDTVPLSVHHVMLTYLFPEEWINYDEQHPGMLHSLFRDRLVVESEPPAMGVGMPTATRSIRLVDYSQYGFRKRGGHRKTL